MNKTNVMRTLDNMGIPHGEREYDASFTDGVSIAKLLGEDPERVFKTLVTAGNDKEHYVFCIPVGASLNLKKAAKAVGVKSIEMIKQKELLPLTGYIHGGCSPIGMKKTFKTVIDETAVLFDKIFVSGGRVGYQIEISLDDLAKLVSFSLADVTDL